MYKEKKKLSTEICVNAEIAFKNKTVLLASIACITKHYGYNGRMNDVKIISIGRELITGRTVDTNSNYLARQITLLGAADGKS